MGVYLNWIVLFSSTNWWETSSWAPCYSIGPTASPTPGWPADGVKVAANPFSQAIDLDGTVYVASRHAERSDASGNAIHDHRQ